MKKSNAFLYGFILGVFMIGVVLSFLFLQAIIVKADGEVYFEDSGFKRFYDPETNVYCYYRRSGHVSCAKGINR